MALVNKAFSVSVAPGMMPPVIHVSEYDIGRSYTVTINGENGEAFTIPTGATASIEGTLNGKVGFSESATIDGNTVSFALTESMTAYSGKAWCKVKLVLNDEPIQTCAFVLAVDRAGVEAETVIGAPGFEEQIEAAVADYLQDFAVDDNVVRDAVDDYLEENGIDPETIAPTITDWLEENVDPVGSAVVVDSSLTVSGAAADAKVTGDKFSENSERISVVEDAASRINQKNYTEGYYLSRTGELVEDANYCVSDKIPIGTFTGACFYYGSGYDSLLKINICTYTADGSFIDYWGGVSGAEYRAVNNFGTAAFLRFSFVKGYEGARLGSAPGSANTEVFWKPADIGGDVSNSAVGDNPTVMQMTSISNIATLKLGHDSLRSPKIFFYGKFTSFSAMEIGHGRDETYTQYFRIDNNNITFYTHGTAGSSIAHGLTMAEYIGVVIDVAYNNNYKITINTLNGTWSRELEYPNVWQGNKGLTFVKNASTAFTFWSLSQSGGYENSKWMFGDSYLSNYSPARWAYYLNEYGIPYTMINAFPGANSEDAYLDWLDAINHGSPKYAIWCLGMNDPDDGAINPTWLSVVNMFLNDCENRGITPILATVPNVPDYTHTYKNAWIKASGYRYIDVAEAVGAEQAGSTWYNGCLETGAVRVHPTEDGARLIFMRAIQDFPEFFNK